MSAVVQRDAKGHWLPGASANPGGQGRSAAAALARRIREMDGAGGATLEELLFTIARDRAEKTSDRLTAMLELLRRGYGAPSQDIAVQLTSDGGETMADRARALPADQVTAVLAGCLAIISRPAELPPPAPEGV